MNAVFSKSSGLGPVQRGQIIQRVLVDGWSPARAATAFELPERRIARWVNDYRRRGMASLRDDAAAEQLALRWLRAVASVLWRGYSGVRRGFGLVEPAPCIVLRRAADKSPTHRADLA